MIRAPLGDQNYWDKACDFWQYSINRSKEILKTPAGDPSYEPQYLFEVVKDNYQCILSRYSRGDPISELLPYFDPLLAAWEASEALGQSVWSEQQQYTRHTWAVNLDHYIVCFWLVGLALALDVSDAQWQRLLVLLGNEGEDTLLDRIIASRSPERWIGERLCHPKPYQQLLDAIDAPPEQQALKLATFVKHWYKELNRPAKPGMPEATAFYNRPYWYTLGDHNFEGGAYFGRWCIEAVAAVKAFGLDDSLCLGHQHYPGDLLRPNGPSTHPERIVEPPETPQKSESEKPAGWFARLFGGK